MSATLVQPKLPVQNDQLRIVSESELNMKSALSDKETRLLESLLAQDRLVNEISRLEALVKSLVGSSP